MANYDAGHYFLTVMAPLDRHAFVEVEGTRRSSIDNVRHLLATLPTAEQDLFSEGSGLNSPFADVPGTHFAHFFVIDDLRYNGRRPSNPFIDLIQNIKMTTPQEIDHLPDAYLVLALDFDAPDGSDASLRAYTEGMWHGMGAELTMLFEHSPAFKGVTDAESFFDFVRAGQITTNLPYNDYWAHDRPIPSPKYWMIGASLAVLALAVLIYAGGLLSGWALVLLSVLALFAVNVAIVAKFGLTPFPKAPESDIASILKALYIQQMFTGFAIDNLGKDKETLMANFDRFCARHKPGDVSGPRQPPGVLRSEWTGQ